MLLPVIAMTLFVVALLTVLFSRAYTNMIVRQEQDENAAGFGLVSRSVTPLIDSSISQVRSIMADDRVVSYARLNYPSAADLVHARLDCRDYLRTEITRQDGIFGLLFMRPDGSLFGTLPEGNFFLDDPVQNPLPEEMKTKILEAPRGRTVWVGPVSGAEIYGFDNAKTPKSIMIAAWQSVDVRYGELCALMLMDESIFVQQLDAIQDGKSIWYLFTEDRVEICNTGGEPCADPERLISESNSGTVFCDENGESVSAFSTTMTDPSWTLVRKVSMADSERVVRGVRSTVLIVAAVVFVVALVLYRSWLKRFMRQFNTLLGGISRMGQGELEPLSAEPFSIGEFETMHREIDRTSKALNEQMDTIRRMEREQMEQEARRKEQETIVRELGMARDIQRNAMPHTFPPFPERKEISTGRLTAANAGHEYPSLRKNDGGFELYKDRHGFVIGGMEGVRYKEYELQMAPGDKLFVYTDGVPEATALSGEMFGTDRMTDALNTSADGSPEEILQTVKNAVDAFVGEAEQFDDLTMLCLEYRGPQPEET